MLRLLVFATIFGLGILCSFSSVAAPFDEVSSRDYAIAGFKPPPRWELLPKDRPSYPQLIAQASRKQGNERAVITLVGKRLPAGTTLTKFAEDANVLKTRPGIENVRLQVQRTIGWFGGMRVQVDALMQPSADDPEHHRQVLRQLYFLNAPFGYVLTLIAPEEQAAARYRDLDDTAANLIPQSTAALDAPLLPGSATPTAVPDGGTSPGATPTTTPKPPRKPAADGGVSSGGSR